MLRAGHRRRSVCSRLCSGRVIAIVSFLASGIVYYLHHYHGMVLHLDMPLLGSIANPLDYSPPNIKPIPLPRFDNLLSPEVDAVIQSKLPKPEQPQKKELAKENRNPSTKPLYKLQPLHRPTAISLAKSRRVKGAPEYLHQINVTFLYVPSLPECINSRLLFAIASTEATDDPSGHAARQRQAVRDTWGSSLSELPDAWRGCAVFYALALDQESEKELLDEAQHQQDTIVLTATKNTLEAYSPRELDVITTGSILFYLVAMHPSAAYVVRTNHRAFWNVKRLISALPEVGNETRRLAGKILRSDWVHRDPGDPTYTSRRQYPDKMYPESALNDPGYAVSTGALRAMERLAETTPLVYLRDMYFTGILRTRVGAELHQLTDIKNSKAIPVSPCHYRLFAASPTVEADEMRSVWAKFTDANHKCSYTLLNEADMF